MIRLEKLEDTFKSATLKTKAFLQQQRWREALVFLFFVLLAFGFWMLQSLQEDYEINIHIPVKYKNIPPEATFIQTPPDRINVRVKDRGSVLLNYTFGRIFAPIDINMKNTTGESGSLHIRRSELENEISKQLVASTTLLQFDPQQIDVHYGIRAHKSVPVTFNGSISTSPGFDLAGPVTISPLSVDVYSNKELIDTLQQISTVFTEIKNADKTVTRVVQLQQSEGTVLEPEMITVTIPVEEFTEKTLEIPVSFTRVPQNYTIRAFPSTIKVNAYVPLSRYKDLTERDFTIEVDYIQLERNINGTVPVILTSKPEWVENATLNPDRIEFIFEQTRHDD